jgi:hypothetical protein
MTDQNFTTAFSVDQNSEEAFAAINNVRGWWTGTIEGDTLKAGDEFTYRYKDVHYSKQRITESIPGQRVVWQVLDACLQFTKDKSEWIGTEIMFDIARKNDRTEVRFTHRGLVPEVECFKACSNAWSSLINSNLRNLIAEDKRQKAA